MQVSTPATKARKSECTCADSGSAKTIFHAVHCDTTFQVPWIALLNHLGQLFESSPCEPCHLWQVQALPKIHAYDEEILGDFWVNDATHMLHYLLKMLAGMQRLDQQWLGVEDEEAAGLSCADPSPRQRQHVRSRMFLHAPL